MMKMTAISAFGYIKSAIMHRHLATIFIDKARTKIYNISEHLHD